MDDFIAIDVETANYDRGSICQIGIVGYIGGEIKRLYSSLINPKCDFSRKAINIHGITPEMVVDAPSFIDAWQEIGPLLKEYPVIAHNASFDIGAILAAMKRCKIDLVEIKYACTLKLARIVYYRAFKSYSLNTLCDALDIPLSCHHDASADAEACALLLLRMADELNARTLDEVMMRSALSMNSSLEYPALKAYDMPEPNLSLASFNSQACDSFEGKTFVITGIFDAFTSRKEVEDIIISRGGEVGTSVTKRTNVLLIGYQDLNRTKGNEKSQKHIKADKLIAKGFDIILMGEDDFLRSIEER